MEQKLYSTILKEHPRRIEFKFLFRHVAGDMAIWLAMAALSPIAWWGKLVSVLLFAVFTFRAFSMMHECVHYAVVAKRRPNDWLGEAYGIFCLLPFQSWRRLHMEHHFWTGNVERDPSMKILAQFRLAEFWVSPVVAYCWRRWVPLLGFLQHRVFWQATLGRREYVFMAGAFVYIVGGLWLLGPFVLGGGALLYLFMVEVINFPHHLGLRQFDGEARFASHQQDRFSRSCDYPVWAAQHIFLNFNLHTEHHLFPAHPWYQLKDLRKRLMETCPEANRSVGNEWIRLHRAREIKEVFAETFDSTERERKRAG